MSFELCAAQVERGDPDRFLSAQTAEGAVRDGLMALYAFNLEVARAPWVTNEPMIAAIRFQWWRDALDEIYSGKTPRKHEVVEPLAFTIAAHDLPQADFAALIDAREADVEAAPHETRAAFDHYIDATSGGLMALAGKICGADHPAIRRFGWGVGVANLLAALPALRAAHKDPLPGEAAPIIADAQSALKEARAQRRAVPETALPALLAGWQADAILANAAKGAEDPRPSEFRRRASFALKAASGRW
ncbi:phytoene/squalene synthase family protein [Paracoccaceae bacterium GXU_MW_L88]